MAGSLLFYPGLCSRDDWGQKARLLGRGGGTGAKFGPIISGAQILWESFKFARVRNKR